MKTCKNCKSKDTCTSICQAVESRLPKEYTGKDTHVEISMDTEAFVAVTERYTFGTWSRDEVASRHPKVDLSILTAKEKKAVLLIASGMSQRAAARRLGIKLSSLQKRVRTARARLLACQFSYLVEDKNCDDSSGDSVEVA